MNFIHTRFYSQLIQFCDYVFLSILWAISSLPLITIAHSTMSTFFVIRGWRKESSDGLLKMFFKEFKNHFFKKIFLSVGLLSFMLVLYIDTKITLLMESNMQTLFLIIAVLSLILVSGTLFNFFNLYTLYPNKSNRLLLKNALLLMISQFLWTLIGFAVICFSALVVFILPMMIFLVAAFTCYFQMKISDKSIKNIEMKQLITET